MPKKTFFLMACFFLSISNNIQTIVEALVMSKFIKDDENCCLACCKLTAKAIASFFRKGTKSEEAEKSFLNPQKLSLNVADKFEIKKIE